MYHRTRDDTSISDDWRSLFKSNFSQKYTSHFSNKKTQPVTTHDSHNNPENSLTEVKECIPLQITKTAQEEPLLQNQVKEIQGVQKPVEKETCSDTLLLKRYDTLQVAETSCNKTEQKNSKTMANEEMFLKVPSDFAKKTLKSTSSPTSTRVVPVNNEASVYITPNQNQSYIDHADSQNLVTKLCNVVSNLVFGENTDSDSQKSFKRSKSVVLRTSHPKKFSYRSASSAESSLVLPELHYKPGYHLRPTCFAPTYFASPVSSISQTTPLQWPYVVSNPAPQCFQPKAPAAVLPPISVVPTWRHPALIDVSHINPYNIQRNSTLPLTYGPYFRPISNQAHLTSNQKLQKVSRMCMIPPMVKPAINVQKIHSNITGNQFGKEVVKIQNSVHTQSSSTNFIKSNNFKNITPLVLIEKQPKFKNTHENVVQLKSIEFVSNTTALLKPANNPPPIPLPSQITFTPLNYHHDESVRTNEKKEHYRNICEKKNDHNLKEEQNFNNLSEEQKNLETSPAAMHDFNQNSLTNQIREPTLVNYFVPKPIVTEKNEFLRNETLDDHSKDFKKNNIIVEQQKIDMKTHDDLPSNISQLTFSSLLRSPKKHSIEKNVDNFLKTSKKNSYFSNESNTLNSAKSLASSHLMSTYDKNPDLNTEHYSCDKKLRNFDINLNNSSATKIILNDYTSKLTNDTAFQKNLLKTFESKIQSSNTFRQPCSFGLNDVKPKVFPGTSFFLSEVNFANKSMKSFSRKALCVGISYKNKTCELKAAVPDAEEVATLLKTPPFNFKVKLLVDTAISGGKLGSVLNPTKKNILSGLHWLMKNCITGDILLFYFSGRTAQISDITGSNEVALAPADFAFSSTKINNVTEPWLLFADELHDIIKQYLIPGVQFISLMDTSFPFALIPLSALVCITSKGVCNYEHRAGRSFSLKFRRQLPVWINWSQSQIKARSIDSTIDKISCRDSRSKKFLDEQTNKKKSLMIYSIQACTDSQDAWELFFENRERGVFSYCLIETLKELKLDNVTILQMFELLCSKHEISRKKFEDIKGCQQQFVLSFSCTFPPDTTQFLSCASVKTEKTGSSVLDLSLSNYNDYNDSLASSPTALKLIQVVLGKVRSIKCSNLKSPAKYFIGFYFKSMFSSSEFNLSSETIERALDSRSKIVASNKEKDDSSNVECDFSRELVVVRQTEQSLNILTISLWSDEITSNKLVGLVDVDISKDVANLTRFQAWLLRNLEGVPCATAEFQIKALRSVL